MQHLPLVLAMTLTPLSTLQAQEWTLQQCLDYAQEHNITVQKSKIQEQIGESTLLQDKAALWPSLSFSMSQSVGYRPFQEQVTTMVQGGQATATSSKATENGNYGLNAQWTIFDGTARQKTIQAQSLNNQIATLSTQQQIQTVQEQIVQLYIQILYSIEAVKVNQQLLETAQRQHDRGAEMLEAGQIARADLLQLEAQLNAAQYDLVNSQTQVAGFKRQLKALLQIDIATSFNPSTIALEDEQALVPIPALEDVYSQALATRPEIKSRELGIDAARINTSVAKAGYWPTISLQAGIGDSHYSASPNSIGNQMKQNLNGSLGLNLSMPILDNRRNRTSIEKARLNEATSQLELAEARQTLASTIESYWLDASSNQQRFIAARSKVRSQEASYELLDEQFKAGLKNIVELLQGRDALISAQQDRLSAKYNTILNMCMLQYYKEGNILLR